MNELAQPNPKVKYPPRYTAPLEFHLGHNSQRAPRAQHSVALPDDHGRISNVVQGCDADHAIKYCLFPGQVFAHRLHERKRVTRGQPQRIDTDILCFVNQKPQVKTSTATEVQNEALRRTESEEARFQPCALALLYGKGFAAKGVKPLKLLTPGTPKNLIHSLTSSF